MFALVRIVCVCRYVFKDERACTHTVSCTHSSVMVKRLVFHTVHSLKAVCPAGTDSIWKTCLNESTHQLHQRILTSSLVCLSHISPFITSLHFLFSPFHHFSFVSWLFLLSMLLFCCFVIIKKKYYWRFQDGVQKQSFSRVLLM